jgi:hypothetical protein
VAAGIERDRLAVKQAGSVLHGVIEKCLRQAGRIGVRKPGGNDRSRASC